MIRSVLREYGAEWMINRSLYSAKLNMLRISPKTEFLFENRVSYPKRMDIFEININVLAQFIKKLPKVNRQELIEQADNACKGIIMGFSSVKLDYGNPVRWQINPITGVEYDIQKKWYQIPDFDNTHGDIKAVWEISRFSHFVTLARAYLLAGNEVYYQTFSEQLNAWLDQNPYSYGANFKCGQECSLRMVNALLAYTVFKKSGLTTDVDRKNMERLIMRCYRKILSNFFYAYRCIRNNHTISELMGMVIGAWCCGNEDRVIKAFYLLDETIDRQFTEDGGYTQYSFNYERLALQDMEVIFSIEEKTGCRLNSLSRKKILNAVKLMFQCQDMTGRMPNYGSNDGALAFPVTSCRYSDFRPVVNTIHVFLTGEKLYKCDKHEEELLWFGIKDVDYLRQSEMKRETSLFPKAGLYTMRKERSWLMAVLNDYRSRPAHMDQMHVDLWVNGINVLCDGGTFSYASELGRGLVYNRSHNTVVYEDKPQMNLYGAFMIYDWTKRGVVKTDRKSVYLEMLSRNGYQHTRKIDETEDGYRITDCVLGENGKRVEVLFHTPCAIQEEEGNLNLLFNRKVICKIKFSAPFRLFRSQRSLYYLKASEINGIAVSSIIQNRRQTINTEIKGA